MQDHPRFPCRQPGSVSRPCRQVTALQCRCMTRSRYSFDQAWDHERARLAGIEALWDEGSRTLLDRCGSASAPAILEVGAGGGSLVQWLAGQAADDAVVVATDLDVRFIDQLAEAGGRVRVEV